MLVGLLGFAVPSLAAAQAGTTAARTGVVFESYTFGDGLAFKRISELTIPISATQRIGSRFVFDVGTAFASATVKEANGKTLDHSGLVDTDVRATVSVIPGRLIFNVVGTIPTGATAVPDTTIPLFGVTATDLLGFTTPGFGSGGGISAGFASAFKMGNSWAVGTGASYHYGASYTPVQGGTPMTPGGEVRGRLGIEGPFGGGKYFRGALVYTTTAANDLGGGGQSTIGDRVLAYAAMSTPLGNSQLQLYGWEMMRMSATAGTVAVPRGNVLAIGARMDRPLGPKATLSPLIEFRHELTGADSTGSLTLLGYLLRTGTDLRYRLGSRATGVVQAQVAFGTLHDGTTSVSLFGPRLGAYIEWAR
ncbi:MAG TPA: hypothetical protein VL549_13200 [Gemmatimonadales bacterium]|nr:hypothetical protein [Gemmatimonadales bacterium]